MEAFLAGFSLMPILAIILIAFLIMSWIIISRYNNVLTALSDVDVQLKKRHDLIPQLLTVAKKFMEHETDLFSKITALRTAATADYKPTNDAELQKHMAAQKELQGYMSQFMMNVENYPELKSDQNMIMVQKTYNEVEEQISAARRFYNSAVNDFNTFIQFFPVNIVAMMMGKTNKPLFEATEEDRKVVNASEFL
jgi:LemA protein